jgi:hypothetical protein
MSKLVGHSANFPQRLETFVGNLQDGLPMPSATSMTAGMENVFAEPGSPRIFFGIDRDQYWIGSIGQVSVFAFGDFVGPELSRTRPRETWNATCTGYFRVIVKRALEKYPEQGRRANRGT